MDCAVDVSRDLCVGRELSCAVGILDCVAVRGSAWDVSRDKTAQALQALACIALAVCVGRELSCAVGILDCVAVCGSAWDGVWECAGYCGIVTARAHRLLPLTYLNRNF